MTGTLRPPPYRPRPKEGEEEAREPKLGEADLRLREMLIKRILVIMGVGALSGVVFILRELPGGGLPYVIPLSRVPSIALWPVTLLLATWWAGRGDMIRALVFALLALGVVSLLGIVMRYLEDPSFFMKSI